VHITLLDQPVSLRLSVIFFYYYFFPLHTYW